TKAATRAERLLSRAKPSLCAPTRTHPPEGHAGSAAWPFHFARLSLHPVCPSKELHARLHRRLCAFRHHAVPAPGVGTARPAHAAGNPFLRATGQVPPARPLHFA